MTLDGLAIACLVDELQSRILGHRVQHVHHSGRDALALECYGTGRRTWLVACTHPAHPATYLADARPPRPSDEVTPLLLRLRKLVEGAAVAGVTSPPLERVVRIDFDGRGDDGEYRVSLVVELIGPASVAVLVDSEGTILEASRRTSTSSPGMRSREIMPRARYALPNPSDRADPRALDGPTLASFLVGEDPGRPLADVIVRRVAACSPQLAREAIAAATGSEGGDPAAIPTGAADAATLDAVARFLRQAWGHAVAGAWAPHVLVPAEGASGRVAFAPYAPLTLPGAVPVASISAAIGEWHDRAIAGQAVVAEAVAARALRQAIESRLDRARARQFSLTRSLADQKDTAWLRVAGDWLLAYPDRLEVGATSVVVDPSDVGAHGEPLTVAVDPAVGAVGNAQRLFRRYQKARAAAREVPPLLEAASQERAYLEEAVVHLDLTRTPDDVRLLREELAAGGFVAPLRRGQNRGTRAPGRPGAKGALRPAGPDGIDRLAIDGYELLVGRSGRGNDAVLRAPGHPDDPWLHARGVAGAHVIVRAAGRPVPEGVLQSAAAVAAGRSAARGAPAVAVDVTARRHVTRVAGGPPGLVTYRNERTIQVAPAVTPGEGRPLPAPGGASKGSRPPSR